MHEPITVEVNDDGTVAEIAVPIDGKGTDSASNASLAQLRNEIVPATVGAVAGAEAGVTGAAAQWKDSTDEMKANLPIVVGFVLLLAFSLMLVAFRSPVIASRRSSSTCSPSPPRTACWCSSSSTATAATSSASPRRAGSTRSSRCSSS